MNIKPYFTMLFFATLTIACKSNQADVASQNQRERGGNRQEPPSIEELFQMDKNGDGLLAKDELTGRILKDFDRIDSNSDGFISREEMENAPKPERRQRPQRS